MSPTKKLPLPYSLSKDAQILQGREWKIFQESMGHKTYEDSGSGWHYLAIVRKRKYGKYLEVPYGPTANSAKSLERAMESLNSLALKNSAVFIRLEPIGKFNLDLIRQFGGVHAPKNFQPKFSLKIDLSQDLETIWKKLSKGRKSAVKIANKHLDYQTNSTKEFTKVFIEMLHDNVSRLKITPHSSTYYQTMVESLSKIDASTICLARDRSKPVASAIFLDSPTTRYYLHASSYPEARSTEAASGILWHMIVCAKEKGLEWFDLFGVAPPNEPNHPWAGFTLFKKSFGGIIVERSGTWEIPVKKTIYRLYRVALSSRAKIIRR